MRPYFPGGTLNAFASSPRGSTLPATSVQNLGRGLQGYLILFAPHAFVPQRQDCPSKLPSLLVFPSISTDFTPTPMVPFASSIFQLNGFPSISKVELWIFNPRLLQPPTHPLCPINPDNAWGLCITAAAGTELATPYSHGTLNNLLPYKSGLQSEDLLPTRGVAGSGFPPLSNILGCCLP